MIYDVDKIIAHMHELCVMSKEVEKVVNLGYLKRDYKSIFLGEPDKICMDIILDYGGVIIDHRVEHGVLFGVPETWIIPGDTDVPDILFGKPINGKARLLILDDYPILIYTIYNEKIYIDEHHGTEFQECHTHSVSSILKLPVEKDKRNSDEY